MTHQIIRIICYAKTPEEAREKAEGILNNNLVRDGKPFDYGTFFDEDNSGVSGKARWGNLPPVVLANSKEGKKLIKEGMKYTKKGFKYDLEKVKEMINFYSDEELFEEEVIDTKKKILEKLDDKNRNNPLMLRRFKYYCSCLGQYDGTCVWLYGNDGQGIKNNEDLKNVLSKWKSGYKGKNAKNNPYKNLNVYVIPIDVHS